MSVQSTTKVATSFVPQSADAVAGAMPQVHLEPCERDSLDRENFFVPRSEEVWDLDSILTHSCLPSTDVQHNSPGIPNPVLLPKTSGFLDCTAILPVRQSSTDQSPRMDIPSLALATREDGFRSSTKPVRHEVRQPLPELIATRRCPQMTTARSVFPETSTVVGKVDCKLYAMQRMPRPPSRALLDSHSDSVLTPSRFISPPLSRPTTPSSSELAVARTVSKVFKQRREIDEHEMRLKNEFKELCNVLSKKIAEIAAEIASLGLEDSFGLREALVRLKDLSATTARNSDVLERDPDMLLSIMHNEIRRIFDEIEVARGKIVGSFLR